MLTSIKDRSVIVTGASKGIGKGIARVFAAQGAKVMVVARGEADTVAALVRDRMERAADLTVPMRVDVGIGENWMAAKG